MTVDDITQTRSGGQRMGFPVDAGTTARLDRVRKLKVDEEIYRAEHRFPLWFQIVAALSFVGAMVVIALLIGEVK